MRAFRISSLCACLLLLAATCAAQGDVKSEAQRLNVSEADLAAIKQAATDYCESWYEGSAEKIERAVAEDEPSRVRRAVGRVIGEVFRRGVRRRFRGVAGGCRGSRGRKSVPCPPSA